ncbi:uncharacterized protein [Aquarana catesbeiana]|uniref:uncharacterized protein isoform X2 n=1 Tax=Aquarana catesbeiana TaxID=8400 RepID=UPI003CCA04D1
MAGKIKSILERALEDIKEKPLEAFRRKLNGTEVEGFSKIAWKNIENKSAEELVDVIWRHYTVKHAPNLVVTILQEINERQASLDLKEELQKANVSIKIEENPVDESIKTVENPANTANAANATTKIEENPVDETIKTVENPVDATIKTVENPVDATIKTVENPRKRPHTALRDRTNYGSCSQGRQRQKNGHEHHPTNSCTDSSQNSTKEDQPAKQIKGTEKKRCTIPRGKPLPDITLNSLTDENINRMKEDHKGKPSVYSCLLFMHLVPYNIFKKWAKKEVNFDGYGGKRAIPNNLLDAIMKEVRKAFGDSKPEDKKQIKNKLNYLLKNPPKTGWPRQF